MNSAELADLLSGDLAVVIAGVKVQAGMRRRKAFFF
jgi:hypothetical protein